MWQLHGDWEGAVTRLVQSPENLNGFWVKGYFNAKIGNQTVHFDNGEISFSHCISHSFD